MRSALNLDEPSCGRRPGPSSRCVFRPATRRPRSARSSPPSAATLIERRQPRRRGRRHRRRVHRRHRRGRRVPRARWCSRPRRSCPSLGPGPARGTRCGSRCTRAEGDIVCWLDADVRNFGAALRDAAGRTDARSTRRSAFVKGYYRRPLHGEAEGGGRVTELMARPLLSALFPHLTEFVQPLVR